MRFSLLYSTVVSKSCREVWTHPVAFLEVLDLGANGFHMTGHVIALDTFEDAPLGHLPIFRVRSDSDILDQNLVRVQVGS